MNFEKITKHQNWLVKTNDGYKCTNCETSYSGTHRKNKKKKLYDTALWQCNECKLYFHFKKAFITHEGWRKIDALHTHAHVAKITTGENYIQILYYRVDKYYNGKMKVIAKPIMKDTRYNNKSHWKREIKGIRGDMYNPYRLVDEEEWRSSTKGLQYTFLNSLYVGHCDLSRNERYKHIPFRKFFDAAHKNGCYDLRNITSFDYRDEIVIKHGNYQLVGDNFDWRLYMKNWKLIKKHKLYHEEIEMLRYTHDAELIKVLPQSGRVQMVTQCNQQTLKRYLKKLNTQTKALYGDYINMVIDLYGTLKKRKYPKNVRVAHDQMTSLTRLQENMQYDQAIRAQAQLGFVFKNEIYIIEPIESVEDLTKQSEVLNHCIASRHYAELYATGQRALYKITRISDGKRLATVAVQDKKIVESRQVNNKDLQPELESFVKKYEREILR